MNELLVYIKGQFEYYNELSTNELRKNGHSKNELWFSSKAESYRDILTKAKSLNLIDENDEGVTTTITTQEYEYMLKDRHFLACLEACGVDNWSGYSYALQMMREDEEEE